MAKIEVLEQHQVTIKENRFLITAFDPTTGLEVMGELQDNGSVSPHRIRELIVKSVTCNGKAITEATYTKIFSRRYQDLMKLFQEVISFNFGSSIEEDNEGNESQGSEEDDS